MVFVKPLFIILASTGLIFIIAGFILYKWPPKEINMLYGYRTKQSMADPKVWNFAQVLAGKSMMVAGLFQIILGTALFPLKISSALGMILGIGGIILISIAMFVITEKLLKQKFN